MSSNENDSPLDLSTFDEIAAAPIKVEVSTPARSIAIANTDLAPQAPLPRLVEISKLNEEDLAAARAQANTIDFRRTNTLLSHGDNVLAGISDASRRLLVDARIGDTGDIGRIAAAVLDGVKILRVEDLQNEAMGDRHVAVKKSSAPMALLRKIAGVAHEAKTAYDGFIENRKQFLDLMDQEEARARASRADLAVTIEMLDRQALAIRRDLHGLKIAIAAGQIALDLAEDEVERLRLHAIETQDPADAADVLDFRGRVANFRAKIAEMRETLVGSALLIPIIGQNRKAAETRLMKISNGILVVIPRLMAVASQAVVAVQMQRHGEQAERLDEASRQISLLAAKGVHDSAIGAARGHSEDPRNIAVLAEVAAEAIRTMNEVIDIEREIASADRERESKLATIRDRLLVGMQGVNKRGLEK